jgi:hypothetical protein
MPLLTIFDFGEPSMKCDFSLAESDVLCVRGRNTDNYAHRLIANMPINRNGPVPKANAKNACASDKNSQASIAARGYTHHRALMFG